MPKTQTMAETHAAFCKEEGRCDDYTTICMKSMNACLPKPMATNQDTLQAIDQMSAMVTTVQQGMDNLDDMSSNNLDQYVAHTLKGLRTFDEKRTFLMEQLATMTSIVAYLTSLVQAGETSQMDRMMAESGQADMSGMHQMDQMDQRDRMDRMDRMDQMDQMDQSINQIKQTDDNAYGMYGMSGSRMGKMGRMDRFDSESESDSDSDDNGGESDSDDSY
jgi:hypothetical protein